MKVLDEKGLKALVDKMKAPRFEVKNLTLLKENWEQTNDGQYMYRDDEMTKELLEYIKGKIPHSFVDINFFNMTYHDYLQIKNKFSLYTSMWAVTIYLIGEKPEIDIPVSITFVY